MKHELCHFSLVGLWLLRFSPLWSSLCYASASHQGHGPFWFSPFASLVCCVDTLCPLSGRREMCSWCVQGAWHRATVLPRKLKTDWEQQRLSLDGGEFGLFWCIWGSHCSKYLYFPMVFLVLSGMSKASLWTLTFSLPSETFICSIHWKGSENATLMPVVKTSPFPLVIHCLLWCFPNESPKYVKIPVFSVNTAAALDPSARNSALQTQLASSWWLPPCSVRNKHFNTALLHAKEQQTLLLRACFRAWMNPRMSRICCQMGVLVWTTV